MPRQLQAIGRPLVAWGNGRPSTLASGWVWPISAVVIAILILFVSIAASSQQRHEAGFDILDEGAHYDYVLRLAQGDLPRSGDHLTQQTLRIISCVGEYGIPPHGCAAKHRNPVTFPPYGYSYEVTQQPPLAYLPYLLTIQIDGSSQQALQDARWGGFIWSVVGAGLLVWVAWMLDLSIIELVGVLAICLLSPVELRSIATVTSDSAALPTGAAVVATYLVSRRRQTPMIVVGLIVGLIVGFMKGLFVVAPFVVLAALIISDIARRRRPTRGDIWVRYGCSAAMFVGAVISYVAWVLIQDARAIVSPSIVLHALEGGSVTSHLRVTTILAGIQNGLSELMAYVPAPLYWIWDVAIYGILAGLLVLKGPVGRVSERAAALAVFFGIAALAVGFPLLNFVEGHYNFTTPARYVLPLLPIIALVAIRAMRTRGVLVVGIALPALAVIYQLATSQF